MALAGAVWDTFAPTNTQENGPQTQVTVTMTIGLSPIDPMTNRVVNGLTKEGLAHLVYLMLDPYFYRYFQGGYRLNTLDHKIAPLLIQGTNTVIMDKNNHCVTVNGHQLKLLTTRNGK